MKSMLNIIMSIAMLYAICGCVSFPDPTVGYTAEWRHRVDQLTAKDFPLPETTEFDSTNALRQAYFEGYLSGIEYAKHILGYGDLMTFCTRTDEELAGIVGWKHGRYAAALKIYSIQNEVEREAVQAYSNRNQQVTFHSNGRLASISDPANPPRAEVSFHLNGRLASIHRYQKINGSNVEVRTTRWYENGQKESDLLLGRSGETTGQHREWYNNGHLRESETFRKGCLEGVCRDYYRNGRRMYVLMFTNDIPFGTARVWNDQGQLVATEMWQGDDWKETLHLTGYLIVDKGPGFTAIIDPKGPIADDLWRFLNKTELETNTVVAVEKDDDGLLWVRTRNSATNGVLYGLVGEGQSLKVREKGTWGTDRLSITERRP